MLYISLSISQGSGGVYLYILPQTVFHHNFFIKWWQTGTALIKLSYSDQVCHILVKSEPNLIWDWSANVNNTQWNSESPAFTQPKPRNYKLTLTMTVIKYWKFSVNLSVYFFVNCTPLVLIYRLRHEIWAWLTASLPHHKNSVIKKLNYAKVKRSSTYPQLYSPTHICI